MPNSFRGMHRSCSRLCGAVRNGGGDGRLWRRCWRHRPQSVLGQNCTDRPMHRTPTGGSCLHCRWCKFRAMARSAGTMESPTSAIVLSRFCRVAHGWRTRRASHHHPSGGHDNVLPRHTRARRRDAVCIVPGGLRRTSRTTQGTGAQAECRTRRPISNDEPAGHARAALGGLRGGKGRDASTNRWPLVTVDEATGGETLYCIAPAFTRHLIETGDDPTAAAPVSGF